jgi:hypothetical protein
MQAYFSGWLWSDGSPVLSATEFCVFAVLVLGTFDGALVISLRWAEQWPMRWRRADRGNP